MVDKSADAFRTISEVSDELGVPAHVLRFWEGKFPQLQPVKRAGGLSGWETTPSVDGHFDRVGTHIDELFGSEDDYREMCQVAADHDGTVIDDIVPGHTGKGADFRLAEMGVDDYPGIYHMVAIPQEDWHLLPDVPEGRDSVNLDAAAEAALADAGLIVGEMQRVIFYEPGVKETNWSVTRPVVGIDGVERRWVYLHYFKDGQPSINWLDPSFAGMRLVIGDALHSLADLTTDWRARAEVVLGEDAPTWAQHLLDRGATEARLRADDLGLEQIEDLASVVLMSVANRRATWGRFNLHAETMWQIMVVRFATTVVLLQVLD